MPAGADKAGLPLEIAVQGGAVDDPNFVGGGDHITYRVDVSSAKGAFTVQAELLYQPLYRFVQDMLWRTAARAARAPSEAFSPPRITRLTALIAAVEPTQAQ